MDDYTVDLSRSIILDLIETAIKEIQTQACHDSANRVSHANTDGAECIGFLWLLLTTVVLTTSHSRVVLQSTPISVHLPSVDQDHEGAREDADAKDRQDSEEEDSVD